MGNLLFKHPQRANSSNKEDYHLRFKNCKSEKGKMFKDTVNVYLCNIFEGNSPLEYERHHTTSAGDFLVCSSLSPNTIKLKIEQVRFRVSSSRSSRSLDSAGEELCKRMFKKKGRYLNVLTKDSLLGVSASCKAWQELFNKAFFSASLEQGPGLLDSLKVDDNTSCIPAW